MKNGADMAGDVVIDVARDVAGDISTTAHLWMGTPNSAWATKLDLISAQH